MYYLWFSKNFFDIEYTCQINHFHLSDMCFTHLIRPNKLSKSHLKILNCRRLSPPWWARRGITCWIYWTKEPLLQHKPCSELPYLDAIRCFTCDDEADNWECNTKSPDVFCQPGTNLIPSLWSKNYNFMFLTHSAHTFVQVKSFVLHIMRSRPIRPTRDVLPKAVRVNWRVKTRRSDVRLIWRREWR